MYIYMYLVAFNVGGWYYCCSFFQYPHLLNNWDSTRDLIGKKPMVYYIGKPIEKGIQTTSHKQNRLLICKQWF